MVRRMNYFLEKPPFVGRKPANRVRSGLTAGIEVTVQVDHQGRQRRIDHNIRGKARAKHFLGDPRQAATDLKVVDIKAAGKLEWRPFPIEILSQRIRIKAAG